jgi:hypothetical protein
MGADRVRRTTLVRLSGAGQEGVGEDATPIGEDQIAFQQAAPTQPVSGDWMFASFSSHLATLDLFLTPPQHDRLRSFRRWAFEAPRSILPFARRVGRSRTPSDGVATADRLARVPRGCGDGAYDCQQTLNRDAFQRVDSLLFATYNTLDRWLAGATGVISGFLARADSSLRLRRRARSCEELVERECVVIGADHR